MDEIRELVEKMDKVMLGLCLSAPFDVRNPEDSVTCEKVRELGWLLERLKGKVGE